MKEKIFYFSDKKGVLEISFGWLFAIIAGAVILFLAIYLGSQIIGSSNEATSAEVGKEISILLNPLETSFETAQTTSITVSAETRIDNICSDESPFGKQSLQVDQKRFNEWTQTDTKVSSYNKYIFSKQQVEGKTFYLFSKPFDFPFKIANLIYLTSKDEVYCFVNPPSEIKQEILNLNQENLVVDNCTKGDIKVCFTTSGSCDIKVYDNLGFLEKGQETFYFDGIENSTALMYAAIFSDKEVYECQVKRLMLRLKELSLIYYDKGVMERKNSCDEMGNTLTSLSNIANSLNNSEEISFVKEFAEKAQEENNARRCLLW